MKTLSPLKRLLVADLFPDLGRRLITLLRSLDEGDWNRPTLCPRWTVKDLAAHLLDTACRRISMERDALPPLAPEKPIENYDDLLGFLNDLNAQWITAAKRVSPRLLTDSLQAIEPQLAAVLGAIDPESTAMFPVSWAGEDESKVWFDVARELTERWHHQQQIRDAVGAPGLHDPLFVEPVMETFLRVLPYRYRDVEAEHGATLALRIVGETAYPYTLVCMQSTRPVEGLERGRCWKLFRGEPTETSTSTIELGERLAWLLFTKGIDPGEARGRAKISGDCEIARPYFDAVAVMA